MTAPTFSESLAAIEGIQVHSGGRRESDNDLPLASIAIATFNAAEVLPATLDSIAAQTWSNIEVTIADGGSNDGTLDVIQAHAAVISRWISAPDSGISDGFSRAVALTTGSAVHIIAAADRLMPDQIERSMILLRDNPNAGIAYGDVEMIDSDGHTTRIAHGISDYHLRHHDSMALVPHMALCARRKTYEQVGLFDPDIRFVMDFDWLARCWRSGIKGIYSNTVGTRMTEGGFNNRHAIARDLENFMVTRRYKTMPMIMAVPRLGLRLVMDVIRLGLEYLGAERASFTFRRWVDVCLGRT